MKNAIERRLDRLHDQWVEFAQQPDARVLRWVIRPDELRLIEVFLEKEADDRAGELPDLFLRFVAPFSDVNGYGEALLDELLAQYEATRPELEAEGIDAAWSPPPGAEPDTHSLIRFVAAATSFRDHYDELTVVLALVLTPGDVADAGEWQRWLLAGAQRLPEPVRIVVLDDAEAPTMSELVQAGPLVISTEADLDMPGAVTELARAGGSATPDAQFRIRFTEMGQAVGRGDLQGARQTGRAALAIAQENAWTHLVGAVHLALGGAFVGAGRTADALEQYRAVTAAGAQLEQQGDPDGVGPKLRLQASFATAAAYVAEPDYAAAAQTYEAVAPLASSAGDPLMLLEAWRMASYCHEQAGEAARAWECGMDGLRAADALPPDQRANSTLPHLGDALLRLAATSPTHQEVIHRTMTELTGTPDWRPQQPAGGAS